MADEFRDSIVWENAIKFINTEIKDLKDLSKVHSLYKSIGEAKNAQEQQLSFASSEAPGRIEKAVKEAELASSQIEGFVVEQELLGGDIANHKADVASLVKKLSALTGQMKEVEKYANYLKVVSRIEDFSSDVQSALLVNSVDRAVAQFFELAEFVESLQASGCRNLVSFANDTVMFWYDILKKKFAGEFEDVLTAWQWPFILSTAKVRPVQNAAEMKEKLGPLFVNLLHLQLPDGLSHLAQSSSPFVQSLPGWRPLLLPIQLMVRPLVKRFRFHFYGSKQTNSLDKPEWYLSQTLSWIRDHREFLRTHIQPLLEQEGLGYVDAVVEFSRGLVMLVMEKMMSDIPELLFDDHMFSHLVDEALMFDQELRSSYSYPASQMGCLYVLTQQQPFKKWLIIEKKFAQEKMDQIFSSNTAWQSQYKDISDMDDLKVPECGESFMTLMLTITERYKHLSSPQDRLDFLDLELDLLEDFRYRLTQIKTDVSQEPMGQCYTAILNTVSYVTDALGTWSELVFFVQLHYYRTIQNQNSETTDEDVTSSEKNSNAELDQYQLDAVQGSVFDDITDLFDRMKNEMVFSIVAYVADDVKARTRPYKNDKWVGMAAPKDLSLGLSSSACEMMLVLRERLQQVEQLLNKPLFCLVWQKVAELLNSYLYHELILKNKFSEGGAHQLNFDMTRNLFPLFGQYTQKPENYFKDLKEACTVLAMPSGSALLLKEVLYQALHDPSSDPNDSPMDPVAALQEQKVYKLCPEEVELLLRLRTDLVS